jgi:hypothetical protein
MNDNITRITSKRAPCPDCFIRYYEGDDPDGFAAEMLAEFGIDVHAPDAEPGEWQLVGGADPWDHRVTGVDENGVAYDYPMRAFILPGGLFDEIYLSGRWPLGS